MPQKVNLNAYFERIGFAGSIAPTLATLELIHGLHAAAISFENLNPLLGLPVKLDHAALEKKLLSERRGGYCYEQNLLLMAMLADLDYSVQGLSARVLWNNPEGATAEPSHMLLRVEINGAGYLVDVGFGDLTLTAPLKLKADTEQTTPHGLYRLLNDEKSWTLEAKVGEDWKPLYAFDLTPRTLADYEASNSFLSTDPASAFTRELRVALSPSGKRLKLLNNRLTIEENGQAAEQRLLSSVAELRAVLENDFGIALPSAELLDPKLEVILADAGVSDI